MIFVSSWMDASTYHSQGQPWWGLYFHLSRKAWEPLSWAWCLLCLKLIKWTKVCVWEEENLEAEDWLTRVKCQGGSRISLEEANTNRDGERWEQNWRNQKAGETGGRLDLYRRIPHLFIDFSIVCHVDNASPCLLHRIQVYSQVTSQMVENCRVVGNVKCLCCPMRGLPRIQNRKTKQRRNDKG